MSLELTHVVTYVVVIILPPHIWEQIGLVVARLWRTLVCHNRCQLILFSPDTSTFKVLWSRIGASTRESSATCLQRTCHISQRYRHHELCKVCFSCILGQVMATDVLAALITNQAIKSYLKHVLTSLVNEVLQKVVSDYSKQLMREML